MLPSMCIRAVSSEDGFLFVSQTCVGREFKSLNFSWKKELKGCKGRSCHRGKSDRGLSSQSEKGAYNRFRLLRNPMFRRYINGPERA